MPGHAPHQPCALIVGAGVAGVSAAIWLRELGVPFDWIEAFHRVGGTLHRVHNAIDNHAGAPFESGAALAASLELHTRRFGLSPSFGVRAVEVVAHHADDPVLVTTDGHPRLDDRAQAQGAVEAEDSRGLDDDREPGAREGERRQTRYSAVIVATGAERRTLDVEGLKRHEGRGVAISGRAERGRFAGRHVVVIGGGDAAFENALLLAEVGCRVTLAHRNDAFRARPHFTAPALAHPSITVLTHATLVALHAEDDADFLTALTLDHMGVRQRVAADGLLVRIGEAARGPRVRLFGYPPTRVGDGFFGVDAQNRTTHPRVLAAGDCACSDFRAVSVAAGQGATAARAAALLSARSADRHPKTI